MHLSSRKTTTTTTATLSHVANLAPTNHSKFNPVLREAPSSTTYSLPGDRAKRRHRPNEPSNPIGILSTTGIKIQILRSAWRRSFPPRKICPFPRRASTCCPLSMGAMISTSEVENLFFLGVVCDFFPHCSVIHFRPTQFFMEVM